MGKLLSGAVILGALVLANVVAAGVFHVFWPLARGLTESWQVAAVVMIGALAIACSLLFLRGVIATVPAWLEAWRRRFPSS